MAGKYLPPNCKATLVADAYTDGSYSLFGVEPSEYTKVDAGATVTLGPFDVAKAYEVKNLSFDFVPFITQEAVAQAQAITISDLVTAQTNVADIGNSATGTQIATAVNSILAILLATGLMEAAE